MSFDLALQAFMKLARVALASILLVGVPLAEAATCAGEDAAASSAYASSELNVEAADADHGSSTPDEAKHCIHNHCHHSAACSPLSDGTPFVLATQGEPTARDSELVLSRPSIGLERPPKA